MQKYGFGSADAMQIMAEAEKYAYADRSEYLGDLRAICLLNRSGLSRYTAKMCLSLLVNLMPQNEQMPLIAIRPARFAQ